MSLATRRGRAESDARPLLAAPRSTRVNGAAGHGSFLIRYARGSFSRPLRTWAAHACVGVGGVALLDGVDELGVMARGVGDLGGEVPVGLQAAEELDSFEVRWRGRGDG